MHGFHTADEGWCWTNSASNISALGYCSRSALHDLQSGALFVRLLFTQCHACLFLFSLLFVLFANLCKHPILIPIGVCPS